MSNIYIRIKGGAPKEQAMNVVGEHEKNYPDPQEFGAMPVYGFFIRHAKNIELDHVELKLENDDFRPAFLLEDVSGATLTNVKATKVGDVPSLILKNVEDVRIKDCRPVGDAKLKKEVEKQL